MTQLKYARFTSGVKTRCTRAPFNFANKALIRPFGPALVGSTLQKTLNLHCGCCKTLPTPANTGFFFEMRVLPKFRTTRNENLRFLQFK